VEAVSRRVLLALALCLFATGAPPGGRHEVVPRGARVGAAPAWVIAAATPPGWTRDCCTYARAIGVNAVLYQGEWSGKPQRVMVLNVWPRQLATLAGDVQADRKRYLQHDPAGKTSTFVVRHPAMPCEASVYQGSDRIDDVLVFCDPGAASGVRLSWSMTIDDNDTARRALLDDLMQVVMATRWAKAAEGQPAHGH
jgi:hypothetical protein